MGVPISFLDKWDPDQFEVLDLFRPVINGTRLYARILIRRKKKGDDIR